MLKMKGMRFPKEIILLCIRWYAAYPLSYRKLEEMLEERGVHVDHSSVSRWTVKFLPMLGFKSFRTASAVLAGIELMRMIRKGQMSTEKGMGLSFAKQFYALAAYVRLGPTRA